jgi:hypothetical protein
MTMAIRATSLWSGSMVSIFRQCGFSMRVSPNTARPRCRRPRVPSDVFVVPSWHPLRLRAASDCILFSFSDRPMQQLLGLWREEKMI